MRIDLTKRPFDEAEYLAGWNIVSQDGEVVGIEGIIPGGKSEANARLIAAAPDLLEALDALWRQAAQSPDLLGTSYGQAALDLAVAALARAKESFPC